MGNKQRTLHHFYTISITLLFVTFFIIASFMASRYEETIRTFMQGHVVSSAFVYVFMASFAVIVPVMSNMMLIPFGAVIFGPLYSSLLCILGWFIGSITAFYLGKQYREFLLHKYPSLKNYVFIDSLLPQKHVYLSLIFLRMTFPVDILSYALSLFSTKLTWKDNAITTLIGIAPFAFIFSYFGEMNLWLQIIVMMITTLIFLIAYFIQKRASNG